MTTTTHTTFGKALAFLDELEKNKFAYKLDHVRNALMVIVNVPGERWEVEFFEDGEIEIERFISTGVHKIEDEALAQLIAEWSD